MNWVESWTIFGYISMYNFCSDQLLLVEQTDEIRDVF